MHPDTDNIFSGVSGFPLEPATSRAGQLGPAIADFMALYPKLRIHLVLSEEQIDPVQGGYDVTLRIADLESSSLIARKILAIDRAICAAPDYLEEHGAPKHPNELRSHALLTYGFLLTGNQWKLTGPDEDHWVQPEWTLCANNAEVLRDAAIAGRGVALLPTFIAGDEQIGADGVGRHLDVLGIETTDGLAAVSV